MNSGTDPLAQTRFDNAMALFGEFVRSNVKHADAATLRGLESRFALRLQIQPSYWSQIKARSRQIGERLARQFEQLCGKPPGWMDEAHRERDVAPALHDSGQVGGASQFNDVASASPSPPFSAPRDDDERFIVGLVLTYYRRHPQRARAKLLDLLGEVLVPGVSPPSSKPAAVNHAPLHAAPAGALQRAGNAVLPADPNALWLRSQIGVAPLKRKR